MNTLAVAAGQGNKKALQQVKKLTKDDNKKEKIKNIVENIKKQSGQKTQPTQLSHEQILELTSGNNYARDKS